MAWFISTLALQATVVYEDDFGGPIGDVLTSVPEIADAGFAAEVSINAALDGEGRLESEEPDDPRAGYRFRIATNPLTAEATSPIRWTATVRMPANDWIAIGFNGEDSLDFLQNGKNTGPFLRFTPDDTWISPGRGTINQTKLDQTHSAGDVVEVQMVYHPVAGTLDVLFDGVRVASDVAIPHEFPEGTPSLPVVWWAQIQLRKQPPAAEGGAYVDDFKIEILRADELYSQWAASYQLQGNETNRFYDADGDGFCNLAEYACGGDPSDPSDAGHVPSYSMVSVDGTNFFEYVYARRVDAFERGLAYPLAVSTNLQAWYAAPVYTDKVTQVGTSEPMAGFEWVTNRVPVDAESQQFLKLRVTGGAEKPELWTALLPDRDAPLSEVWAYADVTRLGEWEELRGDLKVLQLHNNLIPTATEEELKNLADIARDHDIKISVALGAMNNAAVVKNPVNGPADFTFFQKEYPKLKKYTDQGGKIDYISMDDPIRRHLYPVVNGQEVKNDEWTLAEGNAEIVKIMQYYKEYFPGVKIIYITNFPNWGWEDGPAYFRFGYNGNDPQGRGDFKAAFTDLFRQATEAEIEFFAISADNPYSFYTGSWPSNQSQLTSQVDWPERVRTLERFTEDLGMNFILIGNTVGVGGTTAEDFQNETVNYVKDYKAGGGTPYAYMIQSWDPVPTKTLPEDDDFTMSNTVLKAFEEF